MHNIIKTASVTYNFNMAPIDGSTTPITKMVAAALVPCRLTPLNWFKDCITNHYSKDLQQS
jgi:hypothetical protein